MSQKTRKIVGWVLTGLLALVFIMSAFMKLTQDEAAVEQAVTFGIDAATYRIIGIIEVVSLVLFIIPRTGVIGTLLLAAYLGGAIVTHLLHQESVVTPVVIQCVLWIAAVIRFPELLQRLTSAKV